VITNKELKRRVKRGAHFLDEKKRGWEAEIDLAGLEMKRGDACILGQVGGGDYWGFGHKLGVIARDDDEKRAIRYGFNLSGSEQNRTRNWSKLAELWAIEAARRLVKRDRS
jgi:hypothetical protein